MSSDDAWEKNLYQEDKRSQRKERKRLSNADRSKFKKTDQDKLPSTKTLHANIKRSKESFEKGRILSISPEGANVKSEDQIYLCSLKGLLKRSKGLDKNLIVVGDYVLFEKREGNEGQIVHVEPRFSILSRADNLSRRKQQLIASNIDQVMITASFDEPVFKPILLDRYLIAAAKGGMKGIIVINKIDLLKEASDEAKAFYDDFFKAYTKAGYTIIPVSTKTEEGLLSLKEAMKDKTSVFSGQSGVGKTSLINLVTGLNMRTREVVEKTGKGAHTTTYASLIPLTFGGLCIDTPGIKSFGVWDLTPQELVSFFPDIQKYQDKCHFPDCTHTHEEKCAVQKALKLRRVSPLRYDSYCQLLTDLNQEHLRR